MTAAIDATRLRWRYFVLLALRWLPAGLVVPVLVLLPLERGLSLGQLGLAAAAQGIVVILLELPTGGLADTLGRRPVLLIAGIVNMVSLAVFSVADVLPMLAIFFALQGVYRALDSGPLESWYVDALLDIDPEAPLERGLGGGAVVMGVAIGTGALASSALVTLDPFTAVTPLAIPVYIALALVAVEVMAVALLVRESPRAHVAVGLRVSLSGVPAVIREAVGILRRSRILLGLIGAELLWGFGTVTFETLTPARLVDVLGSVTSSAAVMGPLTAAAWLVSSAGSAAVVHVTRRTDVAVTAALLRVLQGLAVVALGVFGGLAGLVTAYLICYATHGGTNAMHMTLLHRQVGRAQRTTVASLNSMAGRLGSAPGLIALTWLADATSLTAAFLTGAFVLAIAAPLYLPGRRSRGRLIVSDGAPVDGVPADPRTASHSE